jgi:probable rRNA maturation factor
MAVTFQNQDITFTLKDKLKIKAWIKRIIEAEKKKLGQLNFVFTSDANLLNINVQFLNHNTYTDIITFDYCEAQQINGDIIISVERVRENAGTFNSPFENELIRVIIHGVLHLCGYKDKSKKDAELMRRKENVALRKFSMSS